jgi:hypothetical protein
MGRRLTIASDLVSRAKRAYVDGLLTWCDSRIEAGGAREARRIWDEMCRRKLLPYHAEAAATNPLFTEPPLSRG